MTGAAVCNAGPAAWQDAPHGRTKQGKSRTCELPPDWR